MMNISRQVFNLFLFLLCIYTATLGFWLIYPYTPITVESPILITNPNKQVKAGEELVYKITYEKKMDIHGILTRKLINEFKIDLADSPAASPVGKDSDKVPIPIPRGADPGKYRLWWSATYKVNPIRTVTVSAESEEFEIVANLDEWKGEKGDIGKRGPAGLTGPTGKGEKGPKGEKGGVSIFGK